MDDAAAQLCSAAHDGDLAAVQLHLAAGVSPNVTAGNGVLTPIWVASATGHADCLAALLAAGGNPSVAHPIGRVTALHAAALGGHEACTQLLLAAGADPTASTTNHRMPLHSAAEKGHLAVVRALVRAAPAAAVAPDDDRVTPLASALFSRWAGGTCMLPSAAQRAVEQDRGRVLSGCCPRPAQGGTQLVYAGWHPAG